MQPETIETYYALFDSQIYPEPRHGSMQKFRSNRQTAGSFEELLSMLHRLQHEVDVTHDAVYDLTTALAVEKQVNEQQAALMKDAMEKLARQPWMVFMAMGYMMLLLAVFLSAVATLDVCGAFRQ